MSYKIETRCIHGENEITAGHSFGAVSVPIYQTATFSHPGIGQSTGFDYSRESNPTRKELETIMSSLEGAVDTVACSTGMAALALCMELFEAGDHILCSEDLYGGSVRIFETSGAKRGLEFSYPACMVSGSQRRKGSGRSAVRYGIAVRKTSDNFLPRFGGNAGIYGLLHEKPYLPLYGKRSALSLRIRAHLRGCAGYGCESAQ